MNKQRRQQISNAANHISIAKEILEGVAEDEENAFESYPDNLKSSDIGMQMEDNINALDEIVEHLSETSDLIEEII